MLNKATAGHNGGTIPSHCERVVASNLAEMAAFDALGPRTRHVISSEMPLKWSALKTLELLRSKGMNPTDRAVDAYVEKWLRREATSGGADAA